MGLLYLSKAGGVNMIKCYELASAVIEEANRFYGEGYKINNDLRNSFKEVCDILDEICAEYGGSGFSVDVDPSSLDIMVGMFCDGFEIDTRKHNVEGVDNKILVIMKVSNNFKVTNVDRGDTMKIEFSFPTIWERL